MKVKYINEYDVELFTDMSGWPATKGDSVILADESWTVRGRVFYPEQGTVVVFVAQSELRIKDTTADDSGRLHEMNRAILALGKRNDLADKKQRLVTEQVSSIRKHINQQIQKDKKNDTR
jgi:hypothetical protein